MVLFIFKNYTFSWALNELLSIEIHLLIISALLLFSYFQSRSLLNKSLRTILYKWGNISQS